MPSEVDKEGYGFRFGLGFKFTGGRKEDVGVDNI